MQKYGLVIIKYHIFSDVTVDIFIKSDYTVIVEKI